MDNIYTFLNGFKLDLDRVIAIGPLDKNNSQQIVIPIYCQGYNKPIEIVLGYSIGITDDKQKSNINSQYINFITNFEKFKTVEHEKINK